MNAHQEWSEISEAASHKLTEYRQSTASKDRISFMEGHAYWCAQVAAERSRVSAPGPWPPIETAPSVEIDDSPSVINIVWRDSGRSFNIALTAGKLIGIVSTVEPPRSKVAWTVEMPAGLVSISPEVIPSTAMSGEAAKLAEEIEELNDVIQSVKGDRGILRVSGTRGDPQDIGVLGIARFSDLARRLSSFLRAAPTPSDAMTAAPATDAVREALADELRREAKVRSKPSIVGNLLERAADALSSAPVAGAEAIKPNSVSQIGPNVSVEFVMPDNSAATALRMRIAFGIRDEKVSLHVPFPRNEGQSGGARS
jgi:hypothetical protein